MTQKKIAGLDYLRALAITLVFLYHYRSFAHPAWIDDLFSFGWTGVDLFFVLSGYLIANHVFSDIEKGNFSPGLFALKRALRILPAYWVVLSLYFAVPAIREWEGLPPLWKFLTFTQNFGLDLRTNRTFSHAWSLCVEEQFYLLLPLTALLFSRFKSVKPAIALLTALFMAGFAARLASWIFLIIPTIGTQDFGATWAQRMYYPTYNRLDGILAGVSIAGLFHVAPNATNLLLKRVNILVIAGLALLTGAYFLCLEQLSFYASIFGYPVIALGFGALTLAAISPYSLVNKHRSGFISKIAALSYAIYLVHKATNHITQEQLAAFGIPADSNLMFLLCAGSAVTGALALHYVVEKPFLKIKEGLVRRYSEQPKLAVEEVYIQK
ncbi:acyltransferase family protein [Polluticoccus soli]|uniref:acyltransferase family protein n=1 Tax=Polluticoccus soli TaxID=3034150 RepID=UPI0023E1B88C|nr:acyltransferase [Flavipsychrobacter sp. JY13-12]